MSQQNFADSVSRLYEQQGANLGRAKEGNAAGWGGLVANLGARIPVQVQQAMQQGAERRRQAQIQQIFQQAGGDLDKAIPSIMAIDPEMGGKLAKQQHEIATLAFEREKMDWEHAKRQDELNDRMLSRVHDEDSFAEYYLARRKMGDDMQGVPTQFDPTWVDRELESRLPIKEQLERRKPKPPTALVPIPGPDGKPVYGIPKEGEPVYEKPPVPPAERLVPMPGPNGPVYGTPTAGAPVYEKPGSEGGGSDYAKFLARFAKERNKSVDDLTQAEELQARKLFGQADDKPSVTVRMDNGMTPGQNFDATMKLGNVYQREVKSAKTVAQQLGLMRASLESAKKGGNMAAASQGILVTFQKILDPISVVRESEYARSASGLAMLSRLEGAYDRMVKGGAGVPLKDLEGFVKLAEDFAKNQEAFANQTKARIDKFAKQYGLDPSLVTDDISAPLDGPAAPAAGPTEGETKPIPGYPGTEQTFRGGKWIRTK